MTHILVGEPSDTSGRFSNFVFLFDVLYMLKPYLLLLFMNNIYNFEIIRF